jgi:hypothetical protein
MLTRDVSHAVQIATEPVVMASLVLDADTGLARGMSVASSGPAARAQAMQQALTKPAGTLPAGLPKRVLCGAGDADAVTRELAAFLDPQPLVSEVVSFEAEDIFDSFVGHMAGRHQPDTFAIPDDWAQLVAAAYEYWQAQPWRRWADDQHLDLVVRVAGVATRYVAIVLGQEGIQYGLVLYPGGVFPADTLQRRTPAERVSMPAGTVMFYLDPPYETPPEFRAKAVRYGWPTDADLIPAWVVDGPDGPADLDQAAVHRSILAITGVLTHDRESPGAITTGELILPGDTPGGFTIKQAA